MQKAFIIDDEGGDGYVCNVIDLFKTKNVSIEHLESISDARNRLSDILHADWVVLDLMMPESDEERDNPEDPTEVGMGFLLTLTEQGFRGKIAVLTNATRERHGAQIEKIESLAKNFAGRISITFKYVHAPIIFISNLFPL